MWELQYSDKAKKQLQKLGEVQRAIILAWMDKNIAGCDDPRVHGKGLVGDRSGEWRYRIGDYRVLCEINEGKLLVLAFSISHRSKAYK
ncbi:MAG: type II toxin-antitoxin system RelE/ParE family toxin [Deferribacteraceae bacterium]|jgi:mRNA interferase RelE/StbE|nr:type II toxin-antitoxin system RelE/ParE family toxin [Deferribacteraceae bacterium]